MHIFVAGFQLQPEMHGKCRETAIIRKQRELKNIMQKQFSCIFCVISLKRSQKTANYQNLSSIKRQKMGLKRTKTPRLRNRRLEVRTPYDAPKKNCSNQSNNSFFIQTEASRGLAYHQAQSACISSRRKPCIKRPPLRFDDIRDP